MRPDRVAVPRLAALDGLRGIAALMVFVHHAQLPGLGVFGGMDAGVLIFFALSGYLLYAPFTRGDVDLRAYAIRRLLRIGPAYLVAAIGIGLLFYPENLKDPVGILTMSHTSVIVAWTLQLEIVFYILLPLVARALRRSSRPVRVLVWTAAGSLVGTLAIMLIRIATLGYVREPDLQTIASFAWAFVPGMLVAQARPKVVPGWIAFIGIALIVLAVGLDLPSYFDVPAGVGAGLLIAYLAVHGFPRVLVPVAAALGALSYSFYLWHEAIVPAIDRPTPSWGGAVAVLLVTAAISTVVYLIVEKPAIELGRRLTAPGFAIRGAEAP